MNTILLMYHCRRFRREVTGVLARRYAVLAAHGPAAAEQLLGSRHPDVVLVESSGLNGSAPLMLEWLRRNHSRAPVVALARSDASHVAMTARRLGAFAVVRWPGPFRRLLEAIARALGGRVTGGE